MSCFSPVSNMNASFIQLKQSQKSDCHPIKERTRSFIFSVSTKTRCDWSNSGINQSQRYSTIYPLSFDTFEGIPIDPFLSSVHPINRFTCHLHLINNPVVQKTVNNLTQFYPQTFS